MVCGIGWPDAEANTIGSRPDHLQKPESSKCSAEGIGRRTLPAEIRHPASNLPLPDLVSGNS